MNLKPVFLALAWSTATVASAQTSTQPLKAPTTKILAMGHFTKGTDLRMVIPVMNDEASATLGFYLDGTFDQFYYRNDGGGVVFLLNVKTIEEARAVLDKLPLSQHHYMEFDLIPIGPLAPLARLLNKPAPAK